MDMRWRVVHRACIFFKSPEMAMQSIRRGLRTLFLPTPFKVQAQRAQVLGAMFEEVLKLGASLVSCEIHAAV